MIGLLYKDLLVLRKQMGTYLLFILVYGFLVLKGVFPTSILSGLVVLTGMMLPMTSFSYDDLARWDKYAAALPAGRRGIVAGKYLLALVCIVADGTVALVLQAALLAFGLEQENLVDLTLVTLSCMGAALLINAVILPFLIKFGAEKSRMISMILFVAIFGGCMLAGTLFKGAARDIAPPAWLISALPILLGVLFVGGFIASFFVSLRIMARKEF